MNRNHPIFKMLNKEAWIKKLIKFYPGTKIYIVGGFVRDTIKQTNSNDIDLLVTGLKHETIVNELKKHGKIIETNGHFKTLKFRPKGWSIKMLEDIDIVIPRIDIPMTDKEFKEAKKIDSTLTKHHAFKIIADKDMDPEMDLERRDITINSMAWDLHTGKLLDPYGGMNDLNDEIIRMTNPLTYKEDPIRMLRTLRFATRYEYNIDSETFQSIIDNARLIKTISMERVHLELFKIYKQTIVSYHFINFFIKLKDTKLIYHLIPNYEPYKIKDIPFTYIQDFSWFMYYIIGKNQNVTNIYKTVFKGDNETEIKLKLIHTGLTFKLDEDKNYYYQWNKLVYKLINIWPKVEQLITWSDDRINIAIKRFQIKNYPRNVKELALDGHDIKKLLNITNNQIKVRGKEIGEMQHKLIDLILNNILLNSKKSLTFYIKNKIYGNIKTHYSS